MNIALLQMNIVGNCPEENITHAEKLMAGHEHVDLFVLPEMWATGFVVQPEGIAEDEDEALSLQWMRKTSARRGCAICGSLAIRTCEGSYYNRHYFVTPDNLFYYDKRHLFTHGKEHEAYRAGTAHTIVEWGGIRFLLQTCYDLRFPLWSRYGIAGLYDAIVYVASWPQSRRDAWEVLLRARAIENQCYVLGVNRVGDDEACHYNGGSMVVDPRGRIVGQCNDNAEQLLSTTLGIDEVMSSRARFDVLSDRDSYPMV
jgi:predicted amidohydrolase